MNIIQVRSSFSILRSYGLVTILAALKLVDYLWEKGIKPTCRSNRQLYSALPISLA